MHALLRHLVHVRRFGKLMSQETHRIVTVIIGQNKDHVTWFGAVNFDRADVRGNWRY